MELHESEGQWRRGGRRTVVDTAYGFKGKAGNVLHCKNDYRMGLVIFFSFFFFRYDIQPGVIELQGVVVMGLCFSIRERPDVFI